MKDLKSLFSKLGLDHGNYLVAFSGGPDSVFLLHALRQVYSDYKDRFAICYINYHDSAFVDDEESIVNLYVDRYQVRLFKDDVIYDREENHNFEDWARKYRYDLFADIVKKEGFNGFLTAHQRNDLIETYLLQKKRNNFPMYWGLPYLNQYHGVNLIRPILEISRKEILDTLEHDSLPFYDDITNHKTTRYLYFRTTEIEDEENIINEIGSKNIELIEFYQNIEGSSSFSFKRYESFNEEQKKRALVLLLNTDSIGETQEQRIGYMKESYDFLKKKSNGFLSLDNDNCLYKTRYGFFIRKDFSKMEYEYQLKKGDTIENELFTLDFENPSLFNVKESGAILRNYHKGDTLATDLPTKDVYSFLRKQQVPAFLIPIYPVFVSKLGEIIGVPFYKDIKEKKIPFSFLLPYLYNEDDE